MDITLTATVDAQRLSAALRSVLPHLAKGKGFPEPLYGVGLTFDGEELCAQGSDGQTMAVHRIPAVPAIETGAAVWTAESAKAVMTWAKGLEGDVVIDGTALTCGEARIAVELMDCQYPNVVGIVEKWSHRPAAPAGHDGAYVVGIDPALLGRFGRTDLTQHPDDKGNVLFMRVVGPSSPVYVSFGDHFAGLVAVA